MLLTCPKALCNGYYQLLIINDFCCSRSLTLHPDKVRVASGQTSGVDKDGKVTDVAIPVVNTFFTFLDSYIFFIFLLFYLYWLIYVYFTWLLMNNLFVIMSSFFLILPYALPFSMVRYMA